MGERFFPLDRSGYHRARSGKGFALLRFAAAPAGCLTLCAAMSWEVSKAGECPLRSALALRAGPPARECQAGRAGGSFTAKTPLLARRKPRECLQGAADRFVPRSRLRAPIEPSRRESGQGWPKATRQGLALTAFGDEGRGESEDGAAVQIGMYLGGSEHLNPARYGPDTAQRPEFSCK